ncbi:MAG TPA: metal ABC transporter ATP-binding protein, partial [Candidatus Nanoarchaeia archaeon]|nr:metal ABC transporter ATP-binding protein [Candidatus Nanoarchaeia archaeon]
HNPIVELRDVSVRYANDVLALDRITLDVNEKDLIALMGPNGAGKSTLLKVILGLVKPTSGTVKLFGCSELTKNLKYVGYVPQSAQARDANLPFNVYETVMIGRTPRAGLFHGMGPKDRKKVEETLKLFGIYELKDRKIGQLSGGQSQRVFLAKAMVSEPKLLLLDEPTSGVDTTSKREFYNTLERLNKERGITVILSSHDISVTTKIANRVLCINRSQFFCGEKEDFEAEKEIQKMYDHPVEIVDHHDHP